MDKKLHKAHAYPIKNFFVRMLTKDISLQDCILDLLDNCLDGAGKQLLVNKKDVKPEIKYEGFKAELSFSADSFSINDNCGGVSIADAVEYAFHFGRRTDAKQDSDFSIGLYGIGMKRAFFKIGKLIHMHSYTEGEAFETTIDVDAWEKDIANWDFDLYEEDLRDIPGTEIVINKLNEGVGEEFADQVFINRIVETIARDYSFFLQDGFEVQVNQTPVVPYQFKLREGKGFEPLSISYTENGTGGAPVQVKIMAGMAAPPPDDDLADVPESGLVAYYGWFVSCNNRIVLAGDKTEKTVWANEGFARWHNQYNGFMGIIDFSCPDPNRLPWDTTKRNLELTNRLYRRALVKMKDATRKYIDYTNQRKDFIYEAKEKEISTNAVPIRSLPLSSEMKLPFIEKMPRIKMATIQYKRPEEEVKKVAASLGSRFMSNKDVGLKTFEYYLDNEIEE